MRLRGKSGAAGPGEEHEGIILAFHKRLLTDFMSIGPVQRQALLSFGSLIAVTGLGYVATFYFAHYLGPAALGAYFLFLAYYGIFDLIGDGGFGGAAVKRISEGRDQREYFTAFVILRGCLLCLSVLVFIIVSPYLAGIHENGLLPLLIVALAAGTIATITSTNLYGTAQVGIMQVSNLANTILKNMVQVVAVFFGFYIGGLVAGFIAGMGVATLINLRFIRLGLSRCNWSHIQRLFTFSFWTFLSSGGMLMFTYADTILIGIYMSEADVGIYRIAFQLSSVASFTVLAFHTVLFPQISRWHAEGNRSGIEHSLSKALTYSFFLAIPVTAGGILLSDRLLYYLYGASFTGGAPVLIILLFAQIGNIFMYLFTMSLNAMDNPRSSFIATGISGILNILLNIILIPIYGVAGAAFVALVTMLLNAFLAYRMLSGTIHIRIETKSVAHLVLSALVMSGFLFAYTFLVPVQDFIGLGIVVLLGAILYSGAVLAIDRPIRNDLKDLLDTMRIPVIP